MRKVNKMRYKQHVGHNFEALLLYRLADREETFIYSLDDEYLSNEKNSREILNEYKRGRYDIVIK